MKPNADSSKKTARWKNVSSEWNRQSISQWFSVRSATPETDVFNQLLDFATEHADVIIPGSGCKPGFACAYDIGDKTIAAWSVRSGKDFKLQIPFGALRINLIRDPSIVDFYLDKLHESDGEFSSIEVKGGWPTVSVKDLSSLDITTLKVLAREISKFSNRNG
jgi:hypothetical protein